jgi:hypothetical protein
VTVLVRWGEREIELTVSDDGRGLASDSTPSAPGSGYGLVGMRERAELFGGTLTAGPRSGGGFHVRFVVPVPAAASSDVGHFELAPADATDDALAGSQAGAPAPVNGSIEVSTGTQAGARSATPTDEDS